MYQVVQKSNKYNIAIPYVKGMTEKNSSFPVSLVLSVEKVVDFGAPFTKYKRSLTEGHSPK